MKKLSLFSLMLMAASMFLFLEGCRKDEVVDPKNEILENRSSVSVRSLPADHIFSERPKSDGCQAKFPKETWNPLAVIRSFGIYNYIKCEGKLNTKNFGEPKWNSTLYHTENAIEYTLTPFRDSEGKLKSVLVIKSKNKEVTFSFVDDSDPKLDARFLWGIFDQIKCYDFSIKFGDKIVDFFESLFGGITWGGPWGGAGGGSGSGFIYTGSSGTNLNGDGGGSTGGSGSGSSGSTGYLNPMGFFYSCDVELTTIEGCNKYFENTWGVSIDNFPNIEEKIKSCGCYRAVMHTKDWSTLSKGQKCLDCYGGSVFSNAEWSFESAMLEDAINNLRFPCIEISNELKNKVDKLKQIVYDEACKSILNPKAQFSPGKLLADFLNGLNATGETYISNGTTAHFQPLSAASLNIAKLGALTGMTHDQIAKLSDEDLCEMLSIVECLEPTAFEGNISNEQKLKLTEWWNSKKNDKLSTKILRDNICSGGDLGSSGNFQLFVEAHYVHNTLLKKYSNYANANVDIDQFLNTNGVEKYLLLANEYSLYEDFSPGIISWQELSSIPEFAPGSSSSFWDRTLSCESFIFYKQTGDKDGQIACVSGLYLSKEIAGVYSNTDDFCLSFLLPYKRFNGITVNPLKASDCAARAANAAAAAVGFVYADRALDAIFMEDDDYIDLFKITFKVKTALSDCGYGLAAGCDQCIGNPKNAVWNQGFFEWLSEELFGCYPNW